MTDAIVVEPKKRGRPKGVGRDPIVGLRMPSALRSRVDTWAAENGFQDRSAAIRRLVEKGLGEG